MRTCINNSWSEWTSYASASHTHDYLPLTGGILSGDLNFSNSSAWIKPYLLAFKNANTGVSPTYPYTGCYQYGDEWLVTARDSSNTWVKNVMAINLVSGVANFMARPTVNGSQVALYSDLANISGDYLPLSGGTLTGNLIATGGVDIRGSGSSMPLKVRGIVGSDGNGEVGELHLQFKANKVIYLGNEGQYTISADGGTYSGTAARATADANGNNIASTYATKAELINVGSGGSIDLSDYALANHSHSLAAYYHSTDAPDINTLTDSLMLVHNSYTKNCPIPGGYVYIKQFFYNSISASSNRIQIAFPYERTAKGFAMRTCISNSWSEWTSYLPASGGTISGNLTVQGQILSNTAIYANWHISAVDGLYIPLSTDSSTTLPAVWRGNDNSLRVGESDYTTNVYNLVALNSRIVCAPTYNNTTTYATNVYVGTTGIFTRTTNTSSRTIKHDIERLVNEDIRAERLYDLDVVQFKYNNNIITDMEDARYGKTLPGFIIEDMDNIYPIAVDKPSDNVKEWSWNAQYLVPPMLKLIQEQHKEDIRLASEIDSLRAELNSTKLKLDAAMMKISEQADEIDQLKAS